MKLKFAGGLRPSVSINAFVPSIYQSADGSFYTQVENKNKIESFEPVNLDNEDVIWISEVIYLQENDDALFAYYREFPDSRFDLLTGTKHQLKFRLLPLIFSKDFNLNAKILVALFFGLAGKASELIDRANDYYQEQNIKIYLSKRLMIDVDTEAVVSGTKLIGEVSYASQLIDNENRLSLIDFFFFDVDHVIFMDYTIQYKDIPISFSLENLFVVQLFIRRRLSEQFKFEEKNAISENLNNLYYAIEERRKMGDLTLPVEETFLTYTTIVKLVRKTRPETTM